jgi:hypothetical protein
MLHEGCQVKGTSKDDFTAPSFLGFEGGASIRVENSYGQMMTHGQYIHIDDLS